MVLQNCRCHFISSHLTKVVLPWRLSGHHSWRCNNIFPASIVLHCPQVIYKPHSCLSSNIFFCLALSTVPCRIIYAIPKDFEMWPCEFWRSSWLWGHQQSHCIMDPPANLLHRHKAFVQNVQSPKAYNLDGLDSFKLCCKGLALTGIKEDR